MTIVVLNVFDYQRPVGGRIPLVEPLGDDDQGPKVRGRVHVNQVTPKVITMLSKLTLIVIFRLRALLVP